MNDRYAKWLAEDLAKFVMQSEELDNWQVELFVRGWLITQRINMVREPQTNTSDTV